MSAGLQTSRVASMIIVIGGDQNEKELKYISGQEETPFGKTRESQEVVKDESWDKTYPLVAAAAFYANAFCLY